MYSLNSNASPPLDASLATALELLEKVWGFPSFLGRQEEAIAATLQGHDTLVVFPTGAGKSITYQLPALLMPGMAVVVSPLIALMQDQVNALRGNGVPAAALNSSMTTAERASVIGAVRRNALKLLYLSPESLLTENAQELLGTCTVSFFAIDEAHCISQWGHDFRQEYRALGTLRERFPDVALHACTATATPAVRDDIIRSLKLRDPVVLVSSFDRPNLTYRFIPRSGGTSAGALRQLLEVLERHRGEAGIVYCLSRKEVESTCEDLVARGWKAVPYHAGMSNEARRANQDAFARENVDIVVATVAFGMGIDRSNVRFVVHTGMPKSVEHYQQEAGRAGRDGLAAECVLLHSGRDVVLWRSLLEKAGTAGDAVAMQKLAEMYRLCRSLTCRHQALLRYFGQGMEQECGACDHCLDENEVLADSVTVARKILSGVARLGGRYGARYVADVLRGARTARIVSNNHDRLSTHGLLKEHGVEAICDWIDQLIAADFLARGEGEYPVVELTPAGHVLMRSAEGRASLSKPRESRARQRRNEPMGGSGLHRGAVRKNLEGDFAEDLRSGSSESFTAPTGAHEMHGAPDLELFAAFRALRRRLAEERNVPPYVIFSDATLLEMAKRLPETDAEFRQIKGVGDVKASTLGPTFLGLIGEWKDAHS